MAANHREDALTEAQIASRASYHLRVQGLNGRYISPRSVNDAYRAGGSPVDFHSERYCAEWARQYAALNAGGVA